ncbi:hypothetical protein Vafri_17110 [Volvox africanus]|uniref:Uncharacterized protein n=1 Tax=Volvox africanus TaxID=51714 RepID=A0A8J4BPK2_9CHLO|nr:hypothetical protein Vafri_17110 [Volvox africanus]
MAEKSNCPHLEPEKDKRISEGGATEPETTWNDIIDKANTQFNGSVLNPSTSGRSHTKRDEVWEARRRFNNLRRREKAKVSHKARVEAARVAQEALEASMSAEQWAEWREAQEAERVQRIAAEAAQAERLAAALATGGPGAGPDSALRIVIDCSFSPESPPKEARCPLPDSPAMVLLGCVSFLGTTPSSPAPLHPAYGHRTPTVAHSCAACVSRLRIPPP